MMYFERDMENQPIQQQNPSAMPHNSEVSFPQPQTPDGKGNGVKIIIAVIGVLLIVVVGGWLILTASSDDGVAPTPSPEGLSPIGTPMVAEPLEAEPVATPTPEPVDKTEIAIQVLNGIGTPGEASFLRDELTDIGFEEITAANADTQNATETVATYSRDLPASVADEITALLESLYQSVRTRRATVPEGFDVTITTGPRGTAATPTPTPQAQDTEQETEE